MIIPKASLSPAFGTSAVFVRMKVSLARAAVEAIKAAKRPVIVAGGGVHYSDAH